MAPEEALGQVCGSFRPGGQGLGVGVSANKGRKAKASSVGERAVRGPGTQHGAASWPCGSESARAPSLPSHLLRLLQPKQPRLLEPG